MKPGFAESMDRPTMADVANRAGVSKMTVSRVINGKQGVSQAAVDSVLEAVDALDYVPSRRGRSLAVGRTQLLGLLVLDIVSEWVWPLIRGAGREAEALGYQVLLRTTGAGEVASFDVQNPLSSGDLIDGLIIVSWRVPLAYARRLARRKFPVVLVDAFDRPQAIDWVSAEDCEGARHATRYLTELGHRRIGFISGGTEPYLARQRFEGFRQGLQEAGLSFDPANVVQGDFSQNSGLNAARSLLRLDPAPTALFAANDLMAIGAIDAAHEIGLDVPADLSIVGFDDIGSAAHMRPALTTVSRPYEEMGAAAASRLIKSIDDPLEARPSIQIDLPTRLIVRNSTSPHADNE